MSTPAIHSLKTILEQTPCGPVDKNSVLGKAIISALAAAWMDLDGSEAQKTWPHKILRAEQVEWYPPNLNFVMERHGPTTMGSIWADLHQWTVNLTDFTASYAYFGKRQVDQKAPAITTKDMLVIAKSIADRIENNIPDPCVSWLKSQPLVKVSLNQVFPSHSHKKRTAEDLRRKLGDALHKEMLSRGWKYKPVRSQIGFER